ncbi:CHAT domain-containing protein [Mycena vulgaris]|nr:CHAT domain-containing protein [Mycena vulgaris]
MAEHVSDDGYKWVPSYFNGFILCNVPTVPDLEISKNIRGLEQSIEGISTEDAKLPKYHRQLGVALQHRYRYSGDLELDLLPGLQHLQTAVALIPDGSPERAVCLASLAQSLREKSHRFEDYKALKAALQNDQEAVNLTPKGHPDRARCLHSLVLSLQSLFQWGELDDIDDLVQMNQEVLDLTSEGDPERAGRLQTLALSFTWRYQRLEDPQDLDAAVEKNQDAVNITPEGHPDRAWHLQNLAGSFTDRFDRLGNPEDLEASLKINQEALDLTPQEHPDRARRLHILGASFRDRYERFGNLKDLEVVLNTHQESLELTSEGHPARVQRQQNLAVIFNDLYERLGDVKDLELSVTHGKDAGDHVQPNNAYRVFFWINHAQSLTERYLRLGDIKDLVLAMEKNQQAVDLMPTAYTGGLRARCLQNLATSFADRYLRLGNLDDLEVALQKGYEALDLFNPEDPGWNLERAVQLRNLGEALWSRYRRLEDVRDLDNAIANTQEAVKLIIGGHPLKARILQNLALTFADRYKRFRDPNDLAAIHLHYSNSFQIPSLSPEDSWKAAMDWGSLSADFQPTYCKIAHTTAFNLLPEILWIGHTISVRHDAIRRLDIGQATSAATRACINSADLTGAVEFTEQGLATIFQQMLQLKTSAEGLDPSLTERFQALSNQLYGGHPDDPLKIANERTELLEEIRKQPGHEYFLLPKPYKTLRYASSGGPIVILNSHKDGCDAIIILNPASEPIHVALPNATILLLKEQQSILKNLLGHWNVRIRAETLATRLFGQREAFSSKTMDECFADMLAWLGSTVIDPVFQALRSHGVHKGRLWWLPTGAFTGLPLHASAPTDQFIHSYTATLGSLLDANAKISPKTSHKVGVVGVTHTGPGGTSSLKGVRQEVKNIRSIVIEPNAQCLEGEQATVAAVELQLQNCPWMHLACHGSQNLSDPTKSCLSLYGGRLELGRILQMLLPNAQFVFLAACETAMGDTELVNESFHLGGGFIAAGFRGAIGTMWTMKDEDGPLVAELVYSHLFRNNQPQASDAAEALQLAVNELKKRNVSYERWIPFIHMGV